MRMLCCGFYKGQLKTTLTADGRKVHITIEENKRPKKSLDVPSWMKKDVTARA